MKLLRLTPEQVMNHWSFIKDCIDASAPPLLKGNEVAMITIQEGLLLDQMQCWVAIESLIENGIYGTMITKAVYDECSGVKNLLIFSVCITAEHPPTLWMESYEQLKKFALSQNCHSIICFSDQQRILEISQSLGADTSWHLIQIPV